MGMQGRDADDAGLEALRDGVRRFQQVLVRAPCLQAHKYRRIRHVRSPGQASSRWPAAPMGSRPSRVDQRTARSFSTFVTPGADHAVRAAT